ncbi:29746_t:CDS:2 [Racocetra persica]|uniref:29746_t:CDS:1 n=1 Tax=Racocetra persica TaxID=160502 RepID=A0ACA9MRN6_9GLOM|nr:29746_t:CDS:2 [Racocetra persica]
MAPQNRGKSSGNPRCPKCSLHYKDIHGHVKRIHNTTLSILKLQVNGKRNQNVQYQDNRTRQDKRNDRLNNRSHLIKQIDRYLRILQLKQLKEELRDVKNKLNKLELLEQESDADLDLHSQNLLMKTEIVQKDTDIDNLTRKVTDLNLVNEERIKLINDLEAQIAKLTSNIEILRSNCKMIDAESIQNATKLHDAESKIADENENIILS